MLGQLNLGASEHDICFYSALSGEIKERIIKEVYLSSVNKVRSYGDWFLIKNEMDAQCAIQIMDIQAKYNKNVKAKAYMQR